VKARIEGLLQAVRDHAERFDPGGLPQVPEPAVELPDESSWLYDADRDPMEQLAAFHRFQGRT
jgi:hypothetical protein